LEYGNGDVYTGDFVGGKREGRGKFECPRLNETIEGGFVNDKVEGEVKIVYGNGNTYEGQMKENKKHGRGRYWFKSRDETHEGEWVNDVKEGEFVETRPKDKYVLRGNYQNGNRHGVFVFTDISSGEQVRQEEWKDGTMLYKDRE
jgi:antitoxin component YwqK of YwqJK toxin-antitoxin module